MPKPLVSIVIPSYNRSKYIAATLNSILKQSFRDFEVIFVDDGSTDNTKEILDYYCQKDYRIKYLHQPNSERAVARSYGMGLALGDYVALVDSDDIWYPKKLEKQVEILENNPDVIL
jgi:glycosyltransferase involved in cell wall biosynthesis